jgi:site-specific recombinase XerD
MTLYDADGNRLYLNAAERAAFLAVARQRKSRDRTLCETLHYTGCRPSELIEITPARIDLSGGIVTIRSLKKRKDSS